ncbi:MAG: tetratricopeptide repeat protein [Planctomycetaceae bacterium]
MAAAQVQQKLNDGIRRHRSGDVAEAARLYSEVLDAEPQNPDAWHLSGLIAFQHNKHNDAEICIRHALSLRPSQADFQANLASVLLAMNRASEAEQICRGALKHQPRHAAALQRLGNSLLKQNRADEAVQALSLAVERHPDNFDAQCNLGAALIESGQPQQAIRFLLRAKALNPNSMHVHLNLGVAQRDSGSLAAAAESLNRAVELAPDCAECYVNRGNVFMDQGDIPAALADFRRAVERNPRLPTALNGLGRALQVLGEWQQAQEAFDLACRLDAPNRRFESNRLYCASLSPNLSRRQLIDDHAEWGRAIEAATPAIRHSRRKFSDQRLRIGYLSPDFRNHATMKFFLPLLKNHSRRDVEVFCYSETKREDSTTESVRQHADQWRHTSPMTDGDLVTQIVEDGIDVLVDLAGHTAGNRLAMMAAKPAPVQVSFLGYPNSTGLSRIDYFLTDAVRESSASAEFFTETLFFLPGGACCFEIGRTDLTESSGPLDSNGFVTFGSTHRLEKFSDECLAVWSRVLQQTADAKLFLFRDVLRHEAVRQQLGRRMQAAGVDLRRVDFAWELPSNHLEVYSRIDILLDVFPWGSGTTAYESMWMGVPIPTIAGDRGACRATASMMHHCGLPELVAESADDYVRLVTELARDHERLTNLRRGIRPKMLQTVCNGARFAADIEAAFRQMVDRLSSPENEETHRRSAPAVQESPHE